MMRSSQKIARQLTTSVKVPPINGPSANPTAMVPAHSPCADARLSCGAETLISATDVAITAATPSPWKARPARRIAASPENAIVTEPSANAQSPSTNMRIMPNVSAKCPMAASVAAVNSM